LNVTFLWAAHHDKQQLVEQLQLAFITFSTIFLKELLATFPICNPSFQLGICFFKASSLTLYFFSIYISFFGKNKMSCFEEAHWFSQFLTSDLLGIS
jgi:hypothetical protein